MPTLLLAWSPSHLSHGEHITRGGKCPPANAEEHVIIGHNGPPMGIKQAAVAAGGAGEPVAGMLVPLVAAAVGVWVGAYL